MRSWDILALTRRIIDITASLSLSLLPLQILCPVSIQNERDKPPFTAERTLGLFSMDEDYDLAGIGCQHNFSTFFSIET
jgi:hypothetical protein